MKIVHAVLRYRLSVIFETELQNLIMKSADVVGTQDSRNSSGCFVHFAASLHTPAIRRNSVHQRF